MPSDSPFYKFAKVCLDNDPEKQPMMSDAIRVCKLSSNIKLTTLVRPARNASIMPPEALRSQNYVFSYGCIIIHTLTNKWPIPTDQYTQSEFEFFCRVYEWERRSHFISLMPSNSSFYEFEKKYCKLHALLPKEVSSNLKSQEIHLQNYIAQSISWLIYVMIFIMLNMYF